MASPPVVKLIQEVNGLENLKWFIGVDWGSQTYQACILDEEGDIRTKCAFPHSAAGFAALTDWILSGAEGALAHQIGVAIETHRGLVVETLIGCAGSERTPTRIHRVGHSAIRCRSPFRTSGVINEGIF